MQTLYLYKPNYDVFVFFSGKTLLLALSSGRRYLLLTIKKKCIWGHNKFERDINSLLQGMINPVWSPECLSSPFLFNHLKILVSECKTKIKTMIYYLMKFDDKNSVWSFKVKRNLRSMYNSSRYWIWHSRRRSTVVEIGVDMWL